MMKQWYEIKKTLSNEILFCRVGDFYELFFDDAERASKILDIQLTRRKISNTTYPMAGVPVRSLETYVARLVKFGHKVAIIDQLEDAKKAKGTVKRGLTRIITKGTITEESMLSPSENNYISAIYRQKTSKVNVIGFAVCDLSTGDFRVGEFLPSEMVELKRAYSKYSPVEILHQQDIADLSKEFHLYFNNDEQLTPIPEFWFDPQAAQKIIFDQFNVKTVKGFGFEDKSLSVGVAGALLKYLQETQFTNFPHFSTIKSLDIQDTMLLDATAIKSLELFNNTQDQTSFASLLELMDETVTPMGGRLLRHWMANPLTDLHKIAKRQESVTFFLEHPMILHNCRASLSEIADVERLITRISLKSARPDELVKLSTSLQVIPDILQMLNEYQNIFPKDVIAKLDPCTDIVELVIKTINANPSNNIGDGKVIRKGFNAELDRITTLLEEGDKWQQKYIDNEKQKTGISSLKIKQNNVYGYFLEISKKDFDKIPEYYIKKQAMINASRYFTEELKHWEEDILEAEILVSDLENTIYQDILDQLSKFSNILQLTSNSIASLDNLCSFSYLAERRNYCKPHFKQDLSLKIIEGRHPVIESIIDTPYQSNNIVFNHDRERILIITGPNFSGKSSLLRATALIVIMAQMGSYIPAKEMELGIIDRIFTRIGASDNLVAGQSTFMLEMVDAANLVNNFTERSLIIADEIGRGTSTYDGLAIAWSITEYLHNHPNSPKTMIATHYHQLSELEGLLVGVKNYQFIIGFENAKPVFNHKLMEGSSDKSFGVEVAKLAGIPSSVIERARYILEILENNSSEVNPEGIRRQKLSELIMVAEGQTSLMNWFEGGINKLRNDNQNQNIYQYYEKPNSNLIHKINSINIEDITPRQALDLLAELKEMTSNE